MRPHKVDRMMEGWAVYALYQYLTPLQKFQKRLNIIVDRSEKGALCCILRHKRPHFDTHCVKSLLDNLFAIEAELPHFFEY